MLAGNGEVSPRAKVGLDRRGVLMAVGLSRHGALATPSARLDSERQAQGRGVVGLAAEKRLNSAAYGEVSV